MTGLLAWLLVFLASPALAAPQAQSNDRVPPEIAKARTAPDGSRYMLDKALFTPDDRWRYEASDQFDRPKARFGRAIAYQAGIVTVGDNRWLPAGAYVKYRVWKFDTADAAREAFAKAAPPKKPDKYVQRKVRALRAGDEARDIADTVVADGHAASYSRFLHIRYGNHLVEVAGYADLKAFGPAPKKGVRDWLCEAPFTAITKAVLSHWRGLSQQAPNLRKP
jgi:hypothetical protein